VGLEVVCAGKGTRYQPEYRFSTPETVWGRYGFSQERVGSGDYNAKKDLQPGDVLDGEGGYTVYGRLVRAQDSLEHGYLPMGLASHVKLLRPVAKDAVVTYADIEVDDSLFSYRLRRAMEEEAKRSG
jgi:predicted homoserine dehydrogenase-like protein